MKVQLTVLLILVLQLAPVIAFNQTYQIGDTLFVWKKQGIKMYANPNASAALMDTLKYGEKVVVSKQVLRSKNAQVKISDDFILNGNWVKVGNRINEGYIFDGYIFKYSPILSDHDKWDIINRKILGLRTRKENKPKEIISNGAKYEITETFTYYQNGYTTEFYFDGCENYTYHYDSISFNELYNLIMDIFTFQFSDYAETPEFLSQKGNSYFFSGTDAIGSYEIKKETDGISLMMYSCY